MSDSRPVRLFAPLSATDRRPWVLCVVAFSIVHCRLFLAQNNPQFCAPRRQSEQRFQMPTWPNTRVRVCSKSSQLQSAREISAHFRKLLLVGERRNGAFQLKLQALESLAFKLRSARFLTYCRFFYSWAFGSNWGSVSSY